MGCKSEEQCDSHSPFWSVVLLENHDTRLSLIIVVCVCNLASIYYFNQFLLMYIWTFKNSIVLKCLITASVYVILQCLTFSGGGGGLVAKTCPTLVTPQTVARLASLTLGFSRQEYWSGLPFPSPGDLPTQELNPGLLHCWQILHQLSYEGSLYSIFMTVEEAFFYSDF